MARVELLPAGPELSAWIRRGGRPDRAAAGTVLAYRWRGWWFERNWQLQRRLHPQAAEPAPAPVFLLGFWRSGTTYLHELLTEVLGWDTPRTWQCFNPSAFRLQGPPRSDISVRRPMDAVEVGPLSPQEDEFALLARGADSAYRFFIDPRRWQEALTALSSAHWRSVGDGWAGDLRLFLSWCTQNRRQPMLVKSPNHLFRAAALRRIWPGSKRLWILREPLQCWPSNLRMWQGMAQRYALWRFDEAELQPFLAACFQAYSALLSEQLTAGLESMDYVVSYDALLSDPAGTVRSIVCWLAGDAAVDEGKLAAAVSRLQRPVAATEEQAMPSAIGTLLQTIREQHRALLDVSRRQFAA